MKKNKVTMLCRKAAAGFASFLFLCNTSNLPRVYAENVIETAISIHSDDPERFRHMGGKLVMKDPDAVDVTDNIYESLIHNERFDKDSYILEYGMDVSVYQREIDWQAVADAGVDFVIVRAGFRGYGQAGVLVADDMYKTNITGAIEAGLNVGVYFFTQAITEEEAIEEAQFTLDLLDGVELTAPVYIDIEDITYDSGRMDNAGLTMEQYTANCAAFCRTIQDGGYRAGVYANKNWLDNYLDHEYLEKNFPIWLAAYSTQTTYTGKYNCWQYSDSGHIPGIEGNVDRDVHYSRKLSYVDDSVLIDDANDLVKPELLGSDNFGTISFEAADPTIVDVTRDGTIIPLKNGKTQITAVCSNGTSDSIDVEVHMSLEINLSKSSLYFSEIGDKKELNVTSNTKEELTYVWETSDSDVVTVDENGVVSSIGCGIASITVTAYNVDESVSASCSVNVVVSTTIVGDCNADGVINAADASEILIFSARSGVDGTLLDDEAVLHIFDYNGDGTVNAVDASEMLIWCAIQGSGGGSVQ